MKINIAISAYNRPEYLQRCIAALYGAKGFDKDKYHIYCAMDCYEDGSFNKDVLDVFFWFRLVPDIAKKKQGCNYTVKKALDMAWEDNPDFVLMLEDDIIISDDALMYVEWAADQYKDDKSVRTIGLWSHDKGYSLPAKLKETDLGQVMKQNYFTCWGWGTWEDRWEEMSSTWTTGDDSHNSSWDVIMSSHLGDRVEILPSIARAYNCGEHGGTQRGRAWPGVTTSGIIDPDSKI
jgi:glycosyltransferase involved in cell wall biosynthesis